MKSETNSHYVWVAIMIDMMNPVNVEVIATSPHQDLAVKASQEALRAIMTNFGASQSAIDQAVKEGRSERFITQTRLTPYRC